jgi:hypothetical protein
MIRICRRFFRRIATREFYRDLRRSMGPSPNRELNRFANARWFALCRVDQPTAGRLGLIAGAGPRTPLVVALSGRWRLRDRSRPMKSMVVRIWIVMGCGALLAACTSGEPPVPVPVVMGSATGADIGSPGNRPSYMPAPPSPAPRRAATELSHKIYSRATGQEQAAHRMSRHLAVAVKEGPRMASSKPVAHRTHKHRHPKLASDGHGQAPHPTKVEAIPLDSSATTLAPEISGNSAGAAPGASTWVSPRPSGQSAND